MCVELRRSGISVVGDIPWGAHFCHFYETQDDLLDIVLPFFAKGLENNEFCMWVVSDALSIERAREALARVVPDCDGRIATGDIEIFPHVEWYLRDGVFDLQRVINGWQKKLDAALAKGYDGMRVNGLGTWLTRADWEDFVRYEKELNSTIAGQRMIVLCTYPLSVSSGSDVFDVARSHQFAIAKRSGDWAVLESPELHQTKEELRVLSEQLENRVDERTSALADTNNRLRAVSARVLSVTEEERTRLSRELHDELGSALTSLRWDLDGLRKSLRTSVGQPAPPELQGRIDEMMKLVDNTLVRAKGIASDLRPGILDDLGLVEAIQWQAERFQSRTGIICHCSNPSDGVDLKAEQSTALFRILQEALTNIMRHAEATRVEIVVNQEDGIVTLTIRDNGKGISPEDRSRTGSLGIWGMLERAETAGGALDIVGSGQGTTVVVRVPVSEKREDRN